MGTATERAISPEVREFIASPRKMLIDGNWVEAASGKTFPVYNPATGDVLARVAEGERDRIGDLILDHLDELAELESLDNGKPFTVARAADVPLAADLLNAGISII